ncbi:MULTISPECIES: CdaR family transcriptional regulator [unclassified Paenibacillus]|uniref:CdaR family transcriptional regulator n=1 Tax=unclassified Paenibacillus TaxID=185978 RepID=UPI0004F7E63D|nr:sugar diacid recognition domain-containing protein [Paenibacillus sp. FSL R5-0345]AIQ38421.1 transcriptional regulator [Paenibacillus sp. FSL R5-0345]
MKISKSLAGQIAQEMMSVVPYNINVMDENGFIVGSGDLKRVGTLHEGARIAIQSGHVFEVYEDGSGMKPGVNEPIIIDHKVLGVVGITGHPDEVRPFSKLVRVTTILLIEQEARNKQEQDDRVRRVKFYHELSYRKEAYDLEFLERASSYGLDLKKKCWAILVDGDVNGKEFRNVSRSYPHYWNLENDKAVFFITDGFLYKELIGKLSVCGDVRRIGSGEAEELAAYSLEQAQAAINIGSRVDPFKKLYNYAELKFLIHLSYDGDERTGTIYAPLDQSGDKTGLIETLQVFIAENGDHNRTVQKLNIHRNTLNYRLNRIHTLTGKNPRNYIDLFELVCGLMWRK